MLKKILVVLVVALAAFAAYVYAQPEDFRIERHAVINAPADVVFAQVNDFHNWEAWSPWAKLDPHSVSKFEGPTSGTGAIFKWAGNSEVGEGQMTITDSKPNELVRIKLDFYKPFEATNNTDFTFKPSGSGTEVAWIMTGKNNFIGRAMCTVMNMQKVLGETFDKGLASMKTISETKAAAPKQ